jgi:hypothetical protein
LLGYLILLCHLLGDLLQNGLLSQVRRILIGGEVGLLIYLHLLPSVIQVVLLALVPIAANNGEAGSEECLEFFGPFLNESKLLSGHIGHRLSHVAGIGSHLRAVDPNMSDVVAE